MPVTLLSRCTRIRLKDEKGTDFKLIKDVIPHIFRIFFIGFPAAAVSYPFEKMGKNAEVKQGPGPFKRL